MSKENKQIARNFVEQVWNARRVDLIDQFIAEDMVPHDLRGITDREGLRQFVVASLAAFPDIRVTIEDEIAEGDRVVHVGRISGTLRGEILGIAPTGKHGEWPGISVFRVAGGKIVDLWSISDESIMMQQLGVMLPTVPAVAEA
jgi:predicted ester cyclase